MLKLQNICKKLGVFSLNNISFSVNESEYFMLIGKSGAGKSMLLEIISGITNPDLGSIWLNNNNITNTPPQKRTIGIVYQKPSLFPHLSVFENLAYPLKIQHKKTAEIKSRVEQLATDTEIIHLLGRKIANLSGGEIQRATIARTLATKPNILLLDEPLSYLDVQLKRDMQALLRKLNQQGQTIIHVTHDYEEALALANRIAIIEHGALIQSGTPQEVFNHPKTEFVANFIGISNFYKGKITESHSDFQLKTFNTNGININLLCNEPVGTNGYLIISSNAILLSEEKLHSSAINNFEGTITDIYQTKIGIEVVINIGIELIAGVSNYSHEQLQLKIGKKVWTSFKASACKFVQN